MTIFTFENWTVTITKTVNEKENRAFVRKNFWHFTATREGFADVTRKGFTSSKQATDRAKKELATFNANYERMKQGKPQKEGFFYGTNIL